VTLARLRPADARRFGVARRRGGGRGAARALPARAQLAGFAADGRSILTASSDGDVRHWPLDPLAAARAARPRDFTAEERQAFGLAAR